MIRTGLLGGSFNPAHGGHRGISLAALAALGLDEVWWLVSPGNPLKPKAGMAPLAARLNAAARVANGTRIRPTAIETELGTRYTIDTLRAIKARYLRRRFIWLMGADNLAQLHLWRDWRGIAREMPIAVIARPGYDGQARAAVAMGWLRRFERPADRALEWTDWTLPAIVLLRFPADPRSASAIRRGRPDWAAHEPLHLAHDPVTHRPLPFAGPPALPTETM